MTVLNEKADTFELFCFLLALTLGLLCVFLRVKVSTKTDGTVNIHPKSVNVEETEFHYNWLVYHLKMRTSSVSESLACLLNIYFRCCIILVFSYMVRDIAC